MTCKIIHTMSAPCETCQRYRHGMHKVTDGSLWSYVCIEHCPVCSPKLEHKEPTEVKTVSGEQSGLFAQ